MMPRSRNARKTLTVNADHVVPCQVADLKEGLKVKAETRDKLP